MDRASALALAEQCRAALAPSCHRIEIAGSIRRGKPQVEDIELVALPKLVPADLFGDAMTADLEFCAVVNQWPAIKGQATGKYTQRRCLDHESEAADGPDRRACAERAVHGTAVGNPIVAKRRKYPRPVCTPNLVIISLPPVGNEADRVGAAGVQHLAR
jgi:hypothetical protein